jgi:hypothetical protein
LELEAIDLLLLRVEVESRVFSATLTDPILCQAKPLSLSKYRTFTPLLSS